MHTETEEEMLIPKRHMAMHILERMIDLGNPKAYANWHDEDLNRDLKLSCRKVSQMHFERSLYVRMREWLKRVCDRRIH